MSHDTDKLIRQLSLVAFLMAERRPLTARDVKGNVEGYSEMSDEAFARRFYSDRAELIALGVPLHSQRDEFTGEELYTLRSEHYFLPKLELTDDELAALLTSLHLLEGKFAYAEPLRLALQNLALGRKGFDGGPSETADRVKVSDPDYTPELAGRLSKLEAAISKQRTIKFSYWSPQRDRVSERTLNPYALRHDDGVWYVIGSDLGDEREKTFRVSRIRSDIRFATRRERDFRLPADFDVESHRRRSPWQIGELAGTARVAVSGDTAWWVKRTLGEAGTLEDGIFETEYAAIEPLASWVLRQNGRAIPLEPSELRSAVASGLTRIRDRHAGDVQKVAREKPLADLPVPDRPAPPVAPERFAVLQALLAYLLAACGDTREAELDADDLAERFHIPREELQEHLSLLNLVNFGGGCYTVYAELDGCRRHRRQGALRRRLPARPASHAARSAGDSTCARLRRAFDRGRLAHDARPRQAQAGGDVRPVRAGPGRAPRRGGRPAHRRGAADRHPLRRDRAPPAGRDRISEGGRGDAFDEARRAVSADARAAVLARAYLGSECRRCPHLPRRSDAFGSVDRRAVRAA